MLGARGVVLDWQKGQGHVRVQGEIWLARSNRDFKDGDTVRVRRRDGLTLIVESE
jgi:membrane-bound serine protease (ClpP class)